MNRIETLMASGKENILNIYCTAGYPLRDSTATVLKAIQSAGADLAEIGMPYSDPLADGPVIQQSSAVALRNGMNISLLLEQLKGCRKEVKIPVILMGYLNPILQYGFYRFCRDAAAAGVDGLILPDMPADAFEEEYSAAMKEHGLSFSFLVTPETGTERIRLLDRLSSGFLYAVSSSSLTGANKDFDEVLPYLQRLQQLSLRNPVLVGFGIHDHQAFKKACRHARGAIIGSAYIQALGDGSEIEGRTNTFIQSILHEPEDHTI